MTEILKIRNFAGIQQLDLELRKINVLIGPQAAGKSICAKLFFYFKGFIHEISSAVENQQNKRELEKGFLNKFEEYFPPQSWSKGQFTIRYELGEIFIQISREDTKRSRLTLTYSDYFYEELKATRQEFRKLLEAPSKKSSRDQWRAFYKTKESLLDRVNNHLGYPAGFNPLFIPAGRSFFAYLQISIFTFLSSNKAMDPFLTEFGRLYENMKSLRRRISEFDDDEKRKKNDIERIIQDILCGKHIHEKGKDFLELIDGRRINVSNSSSGQQEMLPLAVILGVLPFYALGPVGSSVFIEEPEAHLFPTAQRRTVELLATVYNTSESPLQLIITTHSPYILTAFNNLLEAGALSQRLTDKKRAQVNDIVPATQMLKPDDFRAYALANGKAQLICCEDTDLISTNIIDDVSNELSIQFGHLLDLE